MSKSKNKQDNTMLWILIVILLVCFLLIGFLFYKYFYSGISTSKYGDTRLEGIENYPLSPNLEFDINQLYKEEKSVNKVKVDVEGRIKYVREQSYLKKESYKTNSFIQHVRQRVKK